MIEDSIDSITETVKHEIKKQEGFYCIAFIEYMFSAKTFSDYANLIVQVTIKRMTKYCISTLKKNMSSLEFIFKK